MTINKKHMHIKNALIVFTLICALLLFSSGPLLAQSGLLFPARCNPGQNCWIAGYVDVETESGKAADYTCGHRSEDGSHGIEIALPDQVAMQTGIDVLAAADGTVVSARDGMDDKQAAPEQRKLMTEQKTGCGNGVLIDHGNGQQSIYCHLKKNSVSVKAKQKIKAGDKVGQIGESGAAAYPALHFGLFENGKTIDPFTGYEDNQGCDIGGMPLWRDDINSAFAYAPFILYAGGFKGAAPDIKALKIDSYSPPLIKSIASSALVYWNGFFGLPPGAHIVMNISGPDGASFAEKSFTYDETDNGAGRKFYYIGKKAAPLPAGTYTGTTTVTYAPDQTPFTQSFTVTVE